MHFKEVDVNSLSFNPFSLIGKDWALLTAGDLDNFNTMTISWGNMGVMWRKNIVTTYVRPNRYTHDFMENNDYFTLSFFDEDMKEALTFCGKNSGRDVDKISKTGLKPISENSFTFFEQAKLVILCKKIYRDSIRPEGFLADYIKDNYNDDYHDVYMGEILKVFIKE